MRKPLAFLLIISLLLVAGCRNDSGSQREKPNVVLFFIDDYGYGDISFEGNTQIKTPNIDRIATQGAHFTRFYQSSGACAPTRASLLTGRYYLETGVWGVHFGRDYLLRDEMTIADVLQQNGYATGAFGKWHSGKTWSYYSWNRGFDVGVHPVLYRYWDSRVIYNNKLINFDGPVTTLVADQVVKFIKDNKDQPFFAYVPFQSIHEPFNCPDEVFQKYKKQGYSDHVARLYGMIEVLDDNIGKITNSISEIGLDDNTVIMFAVDDGPSPGVDLTYANRRMNDEEKAQRSRGWKHELRGGKANIYEGGSISPFYIQWKDRIIAGTSHDQLSGVIDLFPTILDICGVAIPKDNLPIRGRSLWTLLNGQDVADWEDRMYFDNTNFYRIPRWEINMDYPEMRQMSVHHKDFKLIRIDRSIHGQDTVLQELYNLTEDPKEENNIASEHPKLAGQLTDEVTGWYDQMIGTGRAFGQAVFEVGNWEERASPINLDAVSEISGSVHKSARSEFRFSSWTSEGSGMTFEIDVVEAGLYAVELHYRADPNQLGALFEAQSNNGSADIKIADPAVAMSTPFRLQAGRQQITIALKDLNDHAAGVDVMNLIVVHRIPEEKDNGILVNPHFNLIADGEKLGQFFVDNAVAELRLKGGQQDSLIKLNGKKQLQIIADAANGEQIEKVNVYLDFEMIETKSSAPFEFNIEMPEERNSTINVEFTSRKGIARSARAYVGM